MQGRDFENPDKVKTRFWLIEVRSGKEKGAFVLALPEPIKPARRWILKGPKLKIIGPFETAQALDTYLGIPPMPEPGPGQADPAGN